jgi:hypothetical protein
MLRLLPLFMVATLVVCQNDTPTALDEGFLPVEPVTLEVRLPWSQFVTSAQVVGGFGRADELRVGTIANAFGGTLNARTLMHLESETSGSRVAGVRDSQTTIVGGSFLLRFNPDGSSNQGPVRVAVGRTSTHWDARSATWRMAVDSLDGKEEWPEQGGGSVRPLGEAVWDPLQGDSLEIFFSPSALLTVLDTTALEFGVRVDMETPGELVQVVSGEIQIFAKVEGVDTVITMPPAHATDLTFIYDPAPGPPEGFRVGGVPAWRTVISMALPATVAGTPEACALVACPLALTADRISLANLVLSTRANEPGFQPTDSLLVHARSLFAPEVLPKSPLGPPIFRDDLGITLGATLASAAFAPGGERSIEVPITPLVWDLVYGTTGSGGSTSSTIALLSLNCNLVSGSCVEPASVAFSSFAGAGQPGEPFLRLILTISGQVELP